MWIETELTDDFAHIYNLQQYKRICIFKRGAKNLDGYYEDFWCIALCYTTHDKFDLTCYEDADGYNDFEGYVCVGFFETYEKARAELGKIRDAIKSGANYYKLGGE